MRSPEPPTARDSSIERARRGADIRPRAARRRSGVPARSPRAARILHPACQPDRGRRRPVKRDVPDRMAQAKPRHPRRGNGETVALRNRPQGARPASVRQHASPCYRGSGVPRAPRGRRRRTRRHREPGGRTERARSLPRPPFDPLDQEILTVVDWEGFSQQDVARIVGKPASTVRSRLTLQKDCRWRARHPSW